MSATNKNGEGIPVQWAVTPLSAVVRHHAGDSTLIKGKLSAAPSNGSFPAFSASGQDVWRSAWEEEGEAIVVSAVGARCGKAFLASGRWSAIANTHVIWPEPGGVNHRFLWYRINDESFWVRSGSAQPFVVVKASLENPFRLPPLGEQVRIADALDELLSDLDAGVAALERVRDKLKLYRAAVLKAAVEGALTAEWRREHPRTEPASELLKRILAERRRCWEEQQLRKSAEKGRELPKNWKAKYKEPVPPNTANLPPLPDGWCWATVEQIGETTTGFTPPTSDEGSFGGAIPFFKPTDLDQGYYVRAYRESLTKQGAALGRLLHARSVMVTCIGATIGKTGLARVACATNQQINSLSVNDEFILPEYLYWSFSSPFGQRQIITNASATTLPILNKSRFEALPVATPPRDEQQATVDAVEDQLSVIDHLESDLAAKLSNAQALRQSILRDAFAGRLVPQDPNDEPASELLKRIAAEREQRAREAAAKRLDGRKPRRAAKPRASAARAASDERKHGRIGDR